MKPGTEYATALRAAHAAKRKSRVRKSAAVMGTIMGTGLGVVGSAAGPVVGVMSAAAGAMIGGTLGAMAGSLSHMHERDEIDAVMRRNQRKHLMR